MLRSEEMMIRQTIIQMTKSQRLLPLSDRHYICGFQGSFMSLIQVSGSMHKLLKPLALGPWPLSRNSDALPCVCSSLSACRFLLPLCPHGAVCLDCLKDGDASWEGLCHGLVHRQGDEVEELQAPRGREAGGRGEGIRDEVISETR